MSAASICPGRWLLADAKLLLDAGYKLVVNALLLDLCQSKQSEHDL